MGTSEKNPITMGGYKEIGLKAFEFFKFNKGVFRAGVEFIGNEKVFKLKQKVIRDLPVTLTGCVSQLPIVGSRKMKEQVKMLEKINSKIDGTLGIFDFFINGNWQYVNQNIYGALDRMSPEERIEFDCDCKNINWNSYIENYCKGIAIWFLGEDHVAPSEELSQLIRKNKFLGQDLVIDTFSKKHNFKSKSTKKYEKSILNKDRFYEFFSSDQ